MSFGDFNNTTLSLRSFIHRWTPLTDREIPITSSCNFHNLCSALLIYLCNTCKPPFNRWPSRSGTLLDHCTLDNPKRQAPSTTSSKEVKCSKPGSSRISLHPLTSSVWSFVSCPNPGMLWSFSHPQTFNVSKEVKCSKPGSFVSHCIH
jgi:hypothetical protein